MSYIVPALREAANRARAKAEDVLKNAAAEAEKLRATANELDVIADQKMNATVETPIPETCGNCQQPLVRDELGWRHVYDSTDCTYNAPAAQTGELRAVVSS
jgi:hypothetical protein